MSYIGNQSENRVSPAFMRETLSPNGSATYFDLIHDVPGYQAENLLVTVNNVIQEPVNAYTIINDGNNRPRRLNFGVALATTDSLYVIHRGAGELYHTPPSNSVGASALQDNLKSGNVDSFTATAGQTAFTLSEIPLNANSIHVYVNGIFQKPLTNYTVTGSSTALTLSSGILVGDEVDVFHNTIRSTVSHVADAGVTTTKIADTAITAAKLSTGTTEADSFNLPGQHVKVPSVTTTQRDALTGAVGMMVYNTTLGIMQQYNVNGWASIDSPPTISSLDYPGDDTALDTVGEFNLTGSTTANGDATITVSSTTNLKVGMLITGTGIPSSATVASITNSTTFELSANATATGSANVTLTCNTQTLIISGSNFQTGATVTIDGTTPSTVTRNSSSQITVTGTPAKTAGTKADGLVVTNTSGLAASINVDYSALPAWTTASGNILDAFIDGSAITEIDLAATSATSYAITTGSLAPGLAMSTSTGNITGTLTGTTYTTYNFTVTATDAEAQSSPRLFNIITKDSSPITTGDDVFTASIGGTTFRFYTFRVRQASTSTALLQYTSAMTSGDKTEAKLFGDAAADAYTFTLQDNRNVEVVMIGGGGASSNHHAGGGGSGGALDTAGTAVAWTAGTFTISVGAGGENPASWIGYGTKGLDTTITEGTGGLNGSHTSLIAGGGGISNRNSGYGGTDAGNCIGGTSSVCGGSGGGGSYGGYPGGASTQATFTGYTKYGTAGGLNGNNGGDYGAASGGGVGAAGAGWSSATGSANGGNGRNVIFGATVAESTTIMTAAGVGITDGTNHYYGGGGGGSTYGGTDYFTGGGGKGGGGKGLDQGTGIYSLFAGGHNTGNDINANWSGGQAHTGGGGGGMDRVNSNSGDGAITPWGGSGFVIIKVAA